MPPIKRKIIQLSDIKEIIATDDNLGLKRLLEDNNLNVNIQLAWGLGKDSSFLNIACTMGSINCVKLLIDKGAHLEFVPAASGWSNSDIFSPLSCACVSGSLELLHLLIVRGFKPEDRDLFICLDCLDKSDFQVDKRQAIAAGLIQLVTDVTYNEFGYTFLHRICSTGGVENVKAALERGVDRDTMSGRVGGRDGHDALGVAAAKGHLDVVKLLLDWDKEKPIAQKRVNAAMIEAAKYGHLEVVKFLTEYGADCQAQALIEAMYYAKSLPVAEYLFDNGADINGTLEYISPLIALLSGKRSKYTYTSEKHLPVVRLLLDRGADREDTTHQGDDAVAIAARAGSLDLLQLILDHNKDKPISVDRLNEALLLPDISAEVVKCLLDHGAQADTPGRKENTLLLLLCGIENLLNRYEDRTKVTDYVNLPVIKVLLEHGANPNAVSPTTGETPLLCMSYGSPHALALSTLLLKHGADVNRAYNNTGGTPLMNAAIYEHVDLVKLFLEYGADVMQKDNDGKTVFDLMGREVKYAKVKKLCTEHLAALGSKPLK